MERNQSAITPEMATLLNGLHGNHLSGEVLEQYPVGGKLLVQLAVSGQLKTHVVGRDPDDGSDEWNTERIDHIEGVLVSPEQSPDQLRTSLNHAILHLEDTLIETLRDGLEIVQTQQQLSYFLDHQ